nr:hypothetical protein [Leptosphaeria biglobosa ambi-like virus 1]
MTLSLPLTTSDDDIAILSEFCRTLDFKQRKALITLARSQSIPDASDSPVLFSKVSVILNRLVRYPPYHSLSDELLPEGRVVLRLLHSSLSCGLLIVYALGVELSDVDVQAGKEESFQKELLATQTRRKIGEWNWEALFNPSAHRGEVIHPLFPFASRAQIEFSKQLPSFRAQLRNRIILPHYTGRGVSSETATHLLERVRSGRVDKCHGNPKTFHRNLDRRNITSRDVVHHYIRTGNWSYGKTEMKQRWYPHGLLPRTYFSWGGCDIAVAGYLRNFFNDLGDLFPPTHRKSRVDPSWLNDPSPKHGGFLFYDLTSFTSWFHEQVPFLRSVESYFSGVDVYLLGEDLTLSVHDIGSLVGGYIDWCNNFAEFVVSKGIGKGGFEGETYRHMCAGFLGIPGNLITCTIPHGLALATRIDDLHQLQVPGDDVGIAYVDDQHKRDTMLCASTLGSLQFDKVFSTPELCIYLKRLVIEVGSRIQLADMLIYPLLPYLIDPNDRKPYKSNRFRLPDRKLLRSRAASVMVSFHRDLWRLTKGDIDAESSEIILLFLRRVHLMVGLPEGAIFQGRLYGGSEDTTDSFPGISVKFPVDDDSILYHNPDLEFAGKFITQMSIRMTNEVEVSRIEGGLSAGERIVVRRSRVWSFLEDMGYVKVVGIPGELVELVGAAARDAYLFSTEPPLREVAVLSSMSMQQLAALDIVKTDGMGSFVSPEPDNVPFDVNTRSWRYRRFVDLDDPVSAGFYGKSREWIQEGVLESRSSLSPEPLDYGLDY